MTFNETSSKAIKEEYRRYLAAKEAGRLYDDIYKLYKKPSTAKVYIWLEWCEWARNNGAKLYIRGGNCNTYSIVGEMISDAGEKLFLYITKAHNRLLHTTELVRA